ncbi:hypothetical protein DIPPA_21048 [Diplonema papillatum]|nr:hypothetical protein DIPPA_21048 [Diplonema papillatum]
MAELLKSKDDCVPDAVDWEEVKLSAFPENAATAARDGNCVFADCSTVHGQDIAACARCGGGHDAHVHQKLREAGGCGCKVSPRGFGCGVGMPTVSLGGHVTSFSDTLSEAIPYRLA